MIVSPLPGKVLRVSHEAGESVSNSALVPDPIFTVGNTERLSVRVEVDEADIAAVQLGQVAHVSAAAFKNLEFAGTVVRISPRLGVKEIRTDEPSERVDVKVLETMIELEPGTDLPVGLRVDAFIHVGNSDRVGALGASMAVP